MIDFRVAAVTRHWSERLADGTRLAMMAPPEPEAWLLCLCPPGQEGVASALADEVAPFGFATAATSVTDAAAVAGAVGHLGRLFGAEVGLVGLSGSVDLALASAGSVAVAGVFTWNGTVRLSRTALADVRRPVLLALGADQGRGARWANRRAARRLPLGTARAVADLEAAAVAFGAWWERRPALDDVAATRRLAPALAASLAVVSIAAPAAAAPTTTIASDVDPAQGAPVAEVAGDAASAGAESIEATGDVPLVDGIGLEWFFNEDITFATSSSASGAASEAAFTASVPATTSGGGTTMSLPEDAFDGYNGLGVSVRDAGSAAPLATPPVVTGGAWDVYSDNGPATLACADREAVFAVQDIDGVEVSRRVFVPENDSFARWLNVFTNTSGVDKEVRMATSNNLGSDSNTVFVASSAAPGGTPLAPTGATTSSVQWVTSMQAYSGSTSGDPRLGHVLGDGAGAVGPSNVNFVAGDDNPYWAYDLTVPAGATVIVMNFATGQFSAADALAKAQELAALNNPDALRCMSDDDLAAVANFDVGVDRPPEPPPDGPIPAAPPFTG